MAKTATQLINALQYMKLLDKSAEFVDVVISGEKLDDEDLYEEFAADPYYNYYGILAIYNDKREKIADNFNFGGSLKLGKKHYFDERHIYVIRIGTTQEKFINNKGKEITYNPIRNIEQASKEQSAKIRGNISEKSMKKIAEAMEKI